MTDREYRQDDRRDVGYCPQCGAELAGLTVDGNGYCDTHRWQWAEWNPPHTASGSDDEESED
jgi:hypothetical protein